MKKKQAAAFDARLTMMIENAYYQVKYAMRMRVPSNTTLIRILV
jgi:hypothetical protein